MVLQALFEHKEVSVKKSASGILIIMALALIVSSAFAAVTPSGLISDNAVLQQGIKLPIWGTADAGEKVTVTFQGQTVSTTAKNGWWMLWLNPLKAGGPFTMKINDLEIKNVLVGEVWVCSGQSNMAWQVKSAENSEKVIADSKDPMLRLFLVPKMRWPQVLPNAWQEAAPESTTSFSAVGYFFGKHLRESLNVPVGLIDSSIGGTPADAWTSRSALLSNAALKEIVETPWTRPSYLYNSMIAPLVPYGIRGAIWYQGESNARRAYQYRELLSAMIKNWRDVWGEGDFPFLIVQLAPFGREDPKRPDPSWAELRESQVQVTQTVPKTGIAVITDIGEELNIHPVKKDPVGARLALAARAIAYGEKLIYSGPIYKSSTIKDGKVIVSFDHVGSGLMAKDGDLTGFTVCGEDRSFVLAQAKIEGNTVVVWSADVPKPVAARYGWSNWMVVNLFNKEDLPASPFRTDDFPLTTLPAPTP